MLFVPPSNLPPSFHSPLVCVSVFIVQICRSDDKSGEIITAKTMAAIFFHPVRPRFPSHRVWICFLLAIYLFISGFPPACRITRAAKTFTTRDRADEARNLVCTPLMNTVPFQRGAHISTSSSIYEWIPDGANISQQLYWMLRWRRYKKTRHGRSTLVVRSSAVNPRQDASMNFSYTHKHTHTRAQCARTKWSGRKLTTLRRWVAWIPKLIL